MREITVEELLNKYAAGERDFTKIDIIWSPDNELLNGINLSRADLRNSDLRSFPHCNNCNFIEANLSGLDLTGLHFNGANLSRADLSGADLWRAELEGANLTDANLSRVNLQDIKLWNADFTRANLSGAKLIDAWLDGATLTETNFKDATDVIFENVFFENTIMPDGTIRNGCC